MNCYSAISFLKTLPSIFTEDETLAQVNTGPENSKSVKKRLKKLKEKIVIAVDASNPCSFDKTKENPKKTGEFRKDKEDDKVSEKNETMGKNVQRSSSSNIKDDSSEMNRRPFRKRNVQSCGANELQASPCKRMMTRSKPKNGKLYESAKNIAYCVKTSKGKVEKIANYKSYEDKALHKPETDTLPAKVHPAHKSVKLKENSVQSVTQQLTLDSKISKMTKVPLCVDSKPKELLLPLAKIGENHLEDLSISAKTPTPMHFSLPVFGEGDTVTDSELLKKSMTDSDWDISEIRKTIEEIATTTIFAGDVENSSKAPWEELLKGGQWILIVDTDIFIYHLQLIERVIDTQVPVLGYPVLYVPYRVFCELEALKDWKPRQQSSTASDCAHKAVVFLQQCFLRQHPRIRGQTLERYHDSNDVWTLVAEEKIIQCCLQAKKSFPYKRVIFLSNDANLQTKAILEDLDTFSASEFEKIIMNLDEDITVNDMNLSLLDFQVKSLLDAVFKQILKAESPHYKPRQTLDQSVLQFINRWPNWFCHFVSVNAEELLQKIRENLELSDPKPLVSIIQNSKDFLKYFAIRSKCYFDVVRLALAALDLMQNRAVTLLGPSPDEKNDVGALEGIFHECWITIEGKLERINSKRNIAFFDSDDLSTLTKILTDLTSYLSGILKHSIFHAGSCEEINSLARTLAEQSLSAREDHCVSLLKSVASTVDGRDFMARAKAHFGRVLTRICNKENP